MSRCSELAPGTDCSPFSHQPACRDAFGPIDTYLGLDASVAAMTAISREAARDSAVEVGVNCSELFHERGEGRYWTCQSCVERALRAAIAAEREACAKIVEMHSNPYDGHDCYENDCKPVIAAEIRARGDA